MEKLLARFHSDSEDPVELFRLLIGRIRPRRPSNVASATRRLNQLCELLAARTDLAHALRRRLVALFAQRKQVSLYTSSGLLPSTGFFSETARRISNTLLPDVVDPAYLKDVLGVLFERADDERWVTGVADAHWVALIEVLFGDPAGPRTVCAALAPNEPAPPRGQALPQVIAQLLEGLRVLSFHISALGLEPELLRVDPGLEQHESPFLAQNPEMLAWLDSFAAWWRDPAHPMPAADHLRVMLDQCTEVIGRLRKRTARLGTSLNLTFKLERMGQHLQRVNTLLDLLCALQAERSLVSVAHRVVALFKELVRAECRKNQLSDYWARNLQLLSLRVTENTGRRGEHYITETLGEYLRLLRSAMGAGFVIALMAANKLFIGDLALPPLGQVLAVCLNYGLGFVLIHILGFTVATKQPAMTASVLAASLGEVGNTRTGNLDALVTLIARTLRSQLAAIAGNVGLAIPVAILIGRFIEQYAGAPLVDAARADRLLAEIHPLESGAVFFAGIAGICLFLSGLIAGYYDNLCAYNHIAQRLEQLRWARRLLGERLMRRIAGYVDNNLGALAGNFFFGFLLGGTTALGVLLGLPLDIRHIAFSSAYVGYAIGGLSFSVPADALWMALAGIALIGFMNLAVSFSLALSIALRSRRISFEQGSTLLRLILARFLKQPGEFFFPPRATPPAPPDNAPRTGLPPG